MSDECRCVAVFTSGRQDYGILRSTLLAMSTDPRFDLRLWAGGMHLDERFGRMVDRIRADGFVHLREIPFLKPAAGVAAETAAAFTAVSAALEAEHPEILVLLGDRTETLAAAIAALIAQVPVVHLHGGEESEGAIDNASRHAITKLSHLHLVSHRVHAERVIQMGENPANVIIVGAPGLDNLYRDDLPTSDELSGILGRTLGHRLVVVTVHPATLGAATLGEVRAVARAMEGVDATYVITAPNSDRGGEDIRHFWREWTTGRSNVVFVDALGERAYWGLMRHAHVVMGNSSSGIIEAPAAGAAVINVGDRQRGRLRYGKVVDVSADDAAIGAALSAALDESRVGSRGDGYVPGRAAPRIVEAIARWELPDPPSKRFRDLRCTPT
jgi:UDP-hydrolysing UDP-N-acetyl-D-glucosamine 2-epimerase